MLLVVSRLFALFTLFSCLVVGTVVVRVLTVETSEFAVSLDYISILKSGTLGPLKLVEVVAPDYVFSEIEFPTEPKVAVAKAAKITPANSAKAKSALLPFHEAVVLEKIEMTTQLPSKLVALYRPAPELITEMVAKSRALPEITQVDEVSSQMAKAESFENEQIEEEPVFLDYADEEIAEATIPQENEVTTESVTAAVAVDRISENVDKVIQKVDGNSSEDEVMTNLVAFDYSSVHRDIVDKKTPVISKVTIHKKSAAKSIPSISSPSNLSGKIKMSAYSSDYISQKNITQEETSSGYSSKMIIRAMGSNLKKTYDLEGFELRFQDDIAAVMEDYGNGELTLSENIAEPSMTRSVTLLKRGFVPTNTDLILENGAVEISIPMIEEVVFNELVAPHESSGAVGALLVELDDDTEVAAIDVPFGKVVLLDGDLKATEKEDFRYQLFMGVKAGNALLTYKDIKGKTISKIVHVHEHEVSYEPNIYEALTNESLTLLEEDLLAQEEAPLIVAAEQVRIFAADVVSEKLSDHVYKVNFDRQLLANRRYFEVGHLSEPVFVGIRDVTKVSVPSENFMRFILSRVEGAKLGNRCLVQVNLSRKVARVDVGTESVANSLMTYTQLLDADGKFYDSVGEKTRKIIIVGENQGTPEQGQDSKINLKISYMDGTLQFLNSYCSPNSYLVEQL
jgi:hypothetical protein